jgi:hypothetical protein
MAINKVELRPHHVLYLAIKNGAFYEQPWSAEWYLFDKEDLELKEFLINLNGHPDIPVVIVEGPDFLCKRCKKYDPKSNGCSGYYDGEDTSVPPETLRRKYDEEDRSRHDLSRIENLSDVLNIIYDN